MWVNVHSLGLSGASALPQAESVIIPRNLVYNEADISCNLELLSLIN